MGKSLATSAQAQGGTGNKTLLTYGCEAQAADRDARSITLTKNSQFYVRHGDVERLIAQGYLQRLS
tara:strand:- start:21334 stop:21531 length:198 start_codon:yes stop_codon:yes gene_type:complete